MVSGAIGVGSDGGPKVLEPIDVPILVELCGILKDVDFLGAGELIKDSHKLRVVLALSFDGLFAERGVNTMLDERDVAAPILLAYNEESREEAPLQTALRHSFVKPFLCGACEHGDGRAVDISLHARVGFKADVHFGACAKKVGEFLDHGLLVVLTPQECSKFWGGNEGNRRVTLLDKLLNNNFHGPPPYIKGRVDVLNDLDGLVNGYILPNPRGAYK